MGKNVYYENRVSLLVHNGNICALSVIIAAQFVYANFRFEVGATLTVIAVASLGMQIILNLVERRQLNDHHALEKTLIWHTYLNSVVLFLCIPFFIWTIVLMYEHRVAALVIAPTPPPV
jgi:hypothetical protein